MEKENPLTVKFEISEEPEYKCPFQNGALCPTENCALYILNDHEQIGGECAFRKIATS